MIVSKCFVFRFADVEVHEGELRATRAGQPLEIEPKAFRVLIYLLQHAGHLVSKSELLDAVWSETAVTENSLTRAIALLRRMLQDDPHQPRFIETVSTAGYRFICPVQTESPNERAAESEPGHSSTNPARPRGTEMRRGLLRRRRWVVVAAGTGLAVAAVLFLWYVRQPLRPPHLSEFKQLTQDGRWRWKMPLGSDGARVYFIGRPGGLFAVGSSGEIHTIRLESPWPSDEGVRINEVSPDGRYVLAGPATGLPGLWVFTTAGKPVRFIGRYEEGAGGIWSPDSKQVFYYAPDGKVYAVPAVSGEPRYLFTAKARLDGWFFSFSHDGKRIRYGANNKIWEAESDGSKVHEFLPEMKGSVAKCCGRWTPDGAFYIFASDDKKTSYPWPGGGQLWALDERPGSLPHPNPEPVQLTFDPMKWTFPLISQDSRTIYATGTVRQGELIHFDQHTGQFARYMGGISADWLTFSPDGKYVAYVSYPERKVWRANRDGTGRILLSDPELGASELRWSPDGTRILFVVASTGTGFEAYVVPAQGGKAERLQFPQGENPADPTWSADGKRLAYSVDTVGHFTPNGIRILDLETNRSTPLPTAPVPVWSPRWSPDGRYIFCTAEPSTGNSVSVGIALFDTEKQKWTYFPTKLDWYFPNWAHDNESVYLLGAKAPLEFDGVYRISIPGGQIERIVDLTSVRLTGSMFGYWLGLDPEDHPLLLRDTGSVELYALTLDR